MMNSTQISACLSLSAAALFLSSQALMADPVYTDPIGLNKITCLTNSDTIVGVPFRPQGSINSNLALDPVTAQGGASATLTLTLNSLDPNSLNTHYVKFNGGTRDGRWYDITANTANTLTIALNGDNLDGILSGNSLVIARHWTLDSLFPPAQATTSWTLNTETGIQVPNGHAIVASNGTLAFQRRTELLLPKITGDGINRGISGIHFIHNNQWKILENETTPSGNTILYPDTMLTIRHGSNINHPTIYRSSGEVIGDTFTIPLHTNTNTGRDTYIGIPRPIDLSLRDLNLWESGAFLQSSGNLAFQRRDLLLVYDHSEQSINKRITMTYYHNGINWVAVEDDPKVNRDTSIIPAGLGFIIRKYPTPTGQTSFWQNQSTY